MRVMTSAFSVLALVSLPVAVEAAPCPFPQVRACEPTPNPPVRPPMCHCANPPGSPTWGGNAEIHKKNVPAVKPNKSTGPNDRDRGATMRVPKMVLSVLVLMSCSAAVEAAPCPPGMVRVCEPGARNRPPATPERCRCENAPGSGNLGGGGKAEIHKKNVPTVKPTKSPGSNN